MANNIILPFSELQAELNDEAMIDPNAIIEITENGRYDVARYGYADVNVEGGGGETWETVFEDSVTTEDEGGVNYGALPYNEPIVGDTLKVTFNGTVYECPRIEVDDAYYYGGFNESTQTPDFSEYPFLIYGEYSEGEGGNALYTETAGTYTLKIEEPQSGGSSDFSTAEVEVINTTSDMVSVLAVSIRDTPSSAIVPFGTIMADSDRTHTVPLYKGVCSWKITPADAVVTVSGDISYDNGNIFITGDATITIAGR